MVDLELDGVVDLLTIGPFDNQGSYIRNTTPFGSLTPSFAAPIQMSVNLSADFDRDQKPDLYAVFNSAGLLGRNTTAAGSVSPTIAFQSTPVLLRNAVVGDYDLDGFPDLIAPDGNVAVSRNLMTLGFANGFSAQKSMPAGSNLVQIAVGDLNSDTQIDVAAIRQISTSQFTLTTLISE